MDSPSPSPAPAPATALGRIRQSLLSIADKVEQCQNLLGNQETIQVLQQQLQQLQDETNIITQRLDEINVRLTDTAVKQERSEQLYCPIFLPQISPTHLTSACPGNYSMQQLPLILSSCSPLTPATLPSF